MSSHGPNEPWWWIIKITFSHATKFLKHDKGYSVHELDIVVLVKLHPDDKGGGNQCRYILELNISEWRAPSIDTNSRDIINIE